MFNLIQLQDRLRGFSEDQLKQFLRTPDPNIPDFMVMAALDEKNDAKAQEAQMKAQNQPSVREEMLAVAGLPAMEAGQMASSMAPKSDVMTNTGGNEMMTMARLAEDMPMEDDMEEDEDLDIVETPIRRMNEGGLAGMYFGGRPGDLNPFLDFSGNFIPKVKPRPPSSSIYVDKGTVINEQDEWDKSEGKYYNLDGTLKDEFKNNVASPATDTGGQPDSVRDAQRMMDINEIPERPKKDDDETPPTGTDDPAPRGFLSDLTSSLDKMREDQKEQMEKNQALGLMLEGLKLSRRGVIDEESGKGLQYMGQQQAKVQDRLAQLQGLEAKIGIAGATLAQKDRATQAALKKALEKGSSMTTNQLASEIRGYSADIGKLRKQLGDETVAFDDARIAETEAEIKKLEDLRSLYMADLKGRYGGDILNNDFLKTLLDETQKDK